MTFKCHDNQRAKAIQLYPIAFLVPSALECSEFSELSVSDELAGDGDFMFPLRRKLQLGRRRTQPWE